MKRQINDGVLYYTRPCPTTALKLTQYVLKSHGTSRHLEGTMP